MAHFILDCSQNISPSLQEKGTLEQINLVANETGLFDEGTIKVRINPYPKYSVANKDQDFIHVFAHINKGRTTKQKAHLSKQVVAKLVELFPDVTNIAMNVSGFDKATYCNKTML